MLKVSDRVVLITGASSGIGQACAMRLAARGLRVYGTSRRAGSEAGGIPSSVAHPAVSSAGFPPVSMIAMDVTDDESVIRGVETIMHREGKLDIVVNNAGIGVAGPAEDTSMDEARRQLEVNFFGVVRVCRAVLPVMRAQGGGSIVNIGSIAGMIAIPYQSMYSASKSALEGFSEALRLEVSRLGVRVTIIQPGDHKTGFTQNRELAKMSGRNRVYRRSFQAALGRMTKDEQSGPGPEQVARLVERIVSSPRPRLRYTVGPAPQRAAVWLKRWLPYSMMEYGLRRYYGLDD